MTYLLPSYTGMEDSTPHDGWVDLSLWARLELQEDLEMKKFGPSVRPPHLSH